MHQTGIRLSILNLRLGEPASRSWSLELADVRHDRLNRLQPEPLRGANGWFVPLNLLPDKEESSRLHCLLLNDQGEVTGRFECRPPSRQDQIGVYPAEDGLLLRSGDDLFLLGDAR
jgi:hypothetical protein